jgi:hypothetical protein
MIKPTSAYTRRLKDIRTLLDYMWETEAEDYEISKREASGKRHVFEIMERVSKWLEEQGE